MLWTVIFCYSLWRRNSFEIFKCIRYVHLSTIYLFLAITHIILTKEIIDFFPNYLIENYYFLKYLFTPSHQSWKIVISLFLIIKSIITYKNRFSPMKINYEKLISNSIKISLAFCWFQVIIYYRFLFIWKAFDISFRKIFVSYQW
jgi:hypothetical protein